MNISHRFIIGLILLYIGSIIVGKLLDDVKHGLIDKGSAFLLLGIMVIFMIIGLGWIVDEYTDKRRY